MLLPALSKARDKARAITCANNLKQLHMPLFLYSEDHNGVLIPYVIKDVYAFSILNGKGYFEKFSYLYGNPLAIATINCPSSAGINPDTSRTYTRVNTGYVHYAFNPCTYANGATLPVAVATMNKLTSPSSVFALVDASYYVISTVNFTTRIVSDAGITPTANTNVNTRHARSANLLYTDGHVAPLKHEELLAKVPVENDLPFWYGRNDKENK